MSRRSCLRFTEAWFGLPGIHHVSNKQKLFFRLPYLEYNLFHLLIRGLELSDEDQHHLSGVVVCVLSIHQWDQVANSFEESSQTLVIYGEESISNFAHSFLLLDLTHKCICLEFPVEN